jgi:hypothetical protein
VAQEALRSCVKQQQGCGLCFVQRILFIKGGDVLYLRSHLDQPEL